MNRPASAMKTAAPGAGGMYAAMVGTGAMCALVIVMAFQITAPVIKENRRIALENAIFAILPDAQQFVVYAVGPDGTLAAVTADGAPADLLYAGFDAAGRFVGLAVPAEGMGYQDVIRLLYGYDPHRQVITGINVLELRETPGLGDRILHDEHFLENFQALDVRLADTGQSVAHPIETVKYGEKTQAWQIDGITGATVTSRAVGDILAASSARWAPVVVPQVEVLRAPEVTP